MRKRERETHSRIPRADRRPCSIRRDGLRHDAHLHRRRTRGDPVARALAAAHAARPQQPRVGRAGRHRSRPPAVLRHPPVQRPDAIVRNLPRPGQVVRRRPRPQPRPRAARPQRHRARQPAPQPLVRLVGGRGQPVGAKPAPDPRRQGIRHDRAHAARPSGQRCGDHRCTYRELFSAELADDAPRAHARQPGQGTRRLPGDHRHAAHALRRLPRRARARRCCRHGPLSAAGPARPEDLRRQGPLHGLPLRPQLHERRVRRRRRALLRRARPRR